ncbi:MAG: hypothetical protein L3K03_01105 [Thermoplasmata archaeon]|nr:hypothetical protein [Thermoplasmata archaeon]
MPPPSGMPPPAGYAPPGTDPNQPPTNWSQPPTGQWGGAPPPKKGMLSGKMLYVVIAVIAIVVIVVLAAVLLSGVASNNNNSNSSSAQASTYSKASSQASSYAASYPGGPWKPWIAGGVTTNTAGTSPPINSSEFDSFPSSAGCSVHLLVASGTTYTVPAISGNLSSGASPYWVFWFLNASGILFVTDSGGTITPLLTIDCASFSTFSSFITPIPSTVIDSSAAVQTAWGAGGAAFTTKNPDSTVSMLLTGGESIDGFSVAPSWTITYQACNPTTASTAQVATFTADINASASTKNLISASNSTGACTANADISGGGGGLGGGGSTTTTLSSELGFGTPAVGTPPSAGTYAYTISITDASGGLTWGSLLATVDTSAGGTYVYVGNGNLTVDNILGTAVAVFNLSTDSWTLGSTVSISTTQSLVLYSGIQNISGDTLSFISESTSPSGSVYVNNL